MSNQNGHKVAHKPPPDQNAGAVIDLLCELYPKAFVRYERRRRPLKVGITGDLLKALEGAVTEEELALALRCYCANAVYRGRLKAGAVRIDLNGDQAGEVAVEQAYPFGKRRSVGSEFNAETDRDLLPRLSVPLAPGSALGRVLHDARRAVAVRARGVQAVGWAMVSAGFPCRAGTRAVLARGRSRPAVDTVARGAR